MQEHGRSNDAGRHVSEIDRLIERVELAGVVETGQDERCKAEDIEMHRAWRIDTAIVDEEANKQVDDANCVLKVNGAVRFHFADDGLPFDRDALTQHYILSLAPD